MWPKWVKKRTFMIFLGMAETVPTYAAPFFLVRWASGCATGGTHSCLFHMLHYAAVLDIRRLKSMAQQLIRTMLPRTTDILKKVVRSLWRSARPLQNPGFCCSDFGFPGKSMAYFSFFSFFL